MRLGRSKAPAASIPMQLPERSESVALLTADGVQLPARVLERDGDTLTVAITARTRALTAAELGGLVLEYHSERGRMRLTGSFAIDDPRDPDLLRMASPRSVEVLQQRSYVRIHAARPVVVFCSGPGGRIESFTVDLSGGGMLLAGPDTLAVGQEITFHLSIVSGEPPVTGTAKVVRIDNQGRRAVSFETISDHDRRRLVHFIFECQRAERRRGLRPEDKHG